jgi:hypothetical protein
MQQQLAGKLFQYITLNNPDLLFNLQADRHVSIYIQEKITSVEKLAEQLKRANTPEYLIIEQCMAALTDDLRPSRYLYIKNIVEMEFEEKAVRMRESGVMTYEICSLISHCNPVFSAMGFSQATEDSRPIYNAITGSIAEFFEASEKSLTNGL